ncbi:hypothetical protein HK103_001891 [Boothiomyces macroporosus]|uniref:Thioredoxin domain-containing protein n=1 Tax=Boothiomyces macroporosus TaxID=261099 RepID=A0AAD5UDQ4_9FUNG|nr:hypothetical protein HK103_001891 [Boothiomyces macroporosus]
MLGSTKYTTFEGALKHRRLVPEWKPYAHQLSIEHLKNFYSYNRQWAKNKKFPIADYDNPTDEELHAHYNEYKFWHIDSNTLLAGTLFDWSIFENALTLTNHLDVKNPPRICLLLFWTTFCGASIPHFDNIVKVLKEDSVIGDNISLVTINFDTKSPPNYDMEKIKAKVETREWPYPCYVDKLEDDKFYQLYLKAGGKMTPVTMLVVDGKIEHFGFEEKCFDCVYDICQ